LTEEELAVLGFGQGPVVDEETREKAQDAGTPPGGEDMNIWGHTLPLGAAVLQAPRYIFMGGKTGGPQYASEAELIRDRLVLYGVPSEVILLEQTSTNTLENIVNFMNLYLSENPNQEFDLLGTNYHIDRIEILMDLFGIAWRHGYGSHDVIRKAIEGGYASPVIAAAVNEMGILDIPLSREAEEETGFFERQLGVERKSYSTRDYEEIAFTRMLLEVPEYWMTYLGRIKSDLLLTRVLRNVAWVFPGYLELLGIDPENSDPAMLELARTVLGSIPRRVPPLGPTETEIGWIAEYQQFGLPQKTRDKLASITELRQLNSLSRRVD
jgi:hypothetical protein